MGLELSKKDRRRLWGVVRGIVKERLEGLVPSVLDSRPSPDDVRAYLRRVDFERPMDPVDAVEFAAEGMRRFQVHTDDPRYVGRFNPAPSDMGVAADALVAAFNPQLAAWIYSSFPVEVEQLLIREFGVKLGYSRADVEGTFATGSAEANHTAILVALTRGTSGFPQRGLAEIPERPVLYVSSEGHHSVRKAGRLAGLGDDGVVGVPAGDDFRLDVEALKDSVRRTREAGRHPLAVIATAGTTGSGAVDPIAAVADLAAEEGLWLHVDAAWGGPLVLLPERRGLLAGIERADSITFDAHKWLSVPMGAGVFLTRHNGLLHRTFALATGYMPPSAEGGIDPYAHSLQWSRRFIGLKLFLTLAVAGWEGYAHTIRHQLGLLERLLAQLEARGWRIVNDPRAGVACFVDGTGKVPDEQLPALADFVVRTGRAWITHARIGSDRIALRACITNHRTREQHVDDLVESLDYARREF